MIGGTCLPALHVHGLPPCNHPARETPRQPCNVQPARGVIGCQAAGAGTGTPATWELRREGVALPEPPELQLPLADPFAFLEQHRERLGAHTRAVRGIAPQVPAQRLCLC